MKKLILIMLAVVALMSCKGSPSTGVPYFTIEKNDYKYYTVDQPSIFSNYYDNSNVVLRACYFTNYLTDDGLMLEDPFMIKNVIGNISKDSKYDD